LSTVFRYDLHLHALLAPSTFHPPLFNPPSFFSLPYALRTTQQTLPPKPNTQPFPPDGLQVNPGLDMLLNGVGHVREERMKCEYGDRQLWYPRPFLTLSWRSASPPTPAPPDATSHEGAGLTCRHGAGVDAGGGGQGAADTGEDCCVPPPGTHVCVTAAECVAQGTGQGCAEGCARASDVGDEGREPHATYCQRKTRPLEVEEDAAAGEGEGGEGEGDLRTSGNPETGTECGLGMGLGISFVQDSCPGSTSIDGVSLTVLTVDWQALIDGVRLVRCRYTPTPEP
jgi:hypothetical protein